jgi:uncharacterized protein YceK
LSLLFALGPLVGCGTILTFTGAGGPPGPPFQSGIYGGIRLDAQGLGNGNATYHGSDLGWVKILLFIDFPLSLAFDTVTLPITIPVELCRHSETPEEQAAREANEKAESDRRREEDAYSHAEAAVQRIIGQLAEGAIKPGGARYLQMIGWPAVERLQAEINRTEDGEWKSKLRILQAEIRKSDPIPENWQP